MRLAALIVHWPGEDTYACERHADALNRLANIMEFKLSATPYLGNLPCGNCVSEAKKARGAMPKDYENHEHEQQCQLRYVTAAVAAAEDWGCTCEAKK